MRSLLAWLLHLFRIRDLAVRLSRSCIHTVSPLLRSLVKWLSNLRIHNAGQKRTAHDPPQRGYGHDIVRIEENGVHTAMTISASKQPPVIPSSTPAFLSPDDALEAGHYASSSHGYSRSTNDLATTPTTTQHVSYLPRLDTSLRNTRYSQSLRSVSPVDSRARSFISPSIQSRENSKRPSPPSSPSIAHAHVSRPTSRISGRQHFPPSVDRSSALRIATEDDIPPQGSRLDAGQSTRSSSEIDIGVESTSEIVKSLSEFPTDFVVKDYGYHSSISSEFVEQIYAVDTTYMEWTRYNETPKVPKVQSNFVVTAMRLDYLSPPHDMAGWVSYVHPEGDRYFHHPERRIYTRTNLFNEGLFEKLQYFTAKIDQVKKRTPGMSDDVEYVAWLDLADGRADTPDAREWDCLYYMVSHKERVLFWMSDFNALSINEEVDGVTDSMHMKLALEGHYWKHIECFPEPRVVDPAVVNEAIGILAHAGYDTISSLTSTAAYTSEELQQQLAFVKNLKNVGNIGGYSLAVLGRLMNTFAHERFINFAGQPCARLGRDQSVYESQKRSRSLLITILSPLLFFTPDIHLKELQRIWTDETICQVPWKHFLNGLREEWSRSILHSTILLIVNTTALSIPNVDNRFTSTRNAVQILCYVSTIASVGSIILGFLVTRQYRPNKYKTAIEVASHLDAHKNGLESLAIIYSLPYAGLMWAMITFFAALSCLFFVQTTISTRVPASLVEALVVALIIWCIWVGMIESKELWSRQNNAEESKPIVHTINDIPLPVIYGPKS